MVRFNKKRGFDLDRTGPLSPYIGVLYYYTIDVILIIESGRKRLKKNKGVVFSEKQRCDREISSTGNWFE
jgi:hypothetical protein